MIINNLILQKIGKIHTIYIDMARYYVKIKMRYKMGG